MTHQEGGAAGAGVESRDESRGSREAARLLRGREAGWLGRMFPTEISAAGVGLARPLEGF